MTFSQNPWKHWQIEKLCATMLPKSQKQRSSAMSLAVVTLKKGEGRLLKSGGMWIFDNEVASIMGSFVNGDIVLVHDFDGYPLGRGFINTNSRIVVRLLSREYCDR